MEYKGLVKYWLTFNEINSGTMPMGAILSLGAVKGYCGPVNEVPDEKQIRYQALHHQFMASAKAISMPMTIIPNSRWDACAFSQQNILIPAIQMMCCYARRKCA